ncbi:MAG: hypothetical protein HY319_20590 [Armatimonadetes bacterium]|nr:hypothetical protein [Armatimonadota bacterium]
MNINRSSLGVPRAPAIPAGGKAGEVAGKGLVTVMGRRIPTTYPAMSAEHREEILSKVKPGDILLETNLAYPGWRRMEWYMLGSAYTHAAIYEGEKDGKQWFLEATTPGGVQRTDLREYLDGRLKIAVIRPPYQSQEDVDSALDYCRQQLGKSYDSAFRLDTDDPYCAELPFRGLEQMPHPIHVPTKRAFLGLGREAVGPDSYFEMPGGRNNVIHDDHSTYLGNLAHHWPVGLSGLAGVAGGAWAGASLVGGASAAAAGGAAGLAAGLLLASCIGNKIQVGHFGLSC